MSSHDKPEVDARQRIDRLLQEAGWEPSQIAIEEEAGTGRLDYRLGKLFILEAKGATEDGALSLRAHLQQAQRYQRAHDVPFTMVSDGLLHFIQDQRTRKIERLYYLPSEDQLNALLRDPAALREGFIMPEDGLLPYQKDALHTVVSALAAGKSRMLVEMATGTGKTRLAAEILAEANRLTQAKEGRRLSALFLVDRDNLEDQVTNRLATELQDLKVNQIAELKSARVDVLVAQVATMQHRYTSEPFHPKYFDLIIIDEAHRSVHGESWRKIVEYFECPQIGLTATPPRLGDDETISYFGQPIVNFPYEDAVTQGYLVPFVIHRVKTTVDKNGLNLDGVLFQSQDFGVSVEIENRDRRIVDYYMDQFYGRKCLVFAASSSHAESLWRIFNEEFAKRSDNHEAALVLSTVDSPAARAEIVDEFQRPDSDLKVVINLNILTAGFDFPELDLLFMCRYTRHKSLYLQMKGRGARVPRDQQGRAITDSNGRPLKDRFVMADFVGVTDWERRDMIAAPPVAADFFETDAFPENDSYSRAVDSSNVLISDVPVEIAEVEIITPFDLGEEVSPPTIKAEIAELRAQLENREDVLKRETNRAYELAQQLAALEEARLEDKRASFQHIIEALARALPLVKLDESLLQRAAPEVADLDALNAAFQIDLPSIQSHIERIQSEPMRKRYRELVDLKYSDGLTAEQEAELKRLNAELDAVDDGYYAPIIEGLESRLGRAGDAI